MACQMYRKLMCKILFLVFLSVCLFVLFFYRSCRYKGPALERSRATCNIKIKIKIIKLKLKINASKQTEVIRLACDFQSDQLYRLIPSHRAYTASGASQPSTTRTKQWSRVSSLQFSVIFYSYSFNLFSWVSLVGFHAFWFLRLINLLSFA